LSTLTASWTKSKTTQRRLRDLFAYTLLAVGFFWFIFPLFWVIMSSLKTFEDFNQIPLRIFPSELYLGNYPSAWNSVPFGRYFINTAIIVSLSVVGELISASIVGFGFSRLKFWGRNFLFMVLLSTMMLPFWVVIIPRFLLYRDIGWVGTWLPLIVPSYFANPVYVFLMRQFFMTLPSELDDAAKIDGSGDFGIYRNIILPLTKPILSALAIFVFLGAFNAYLWPLVILNEEKKLTLPLIIARMANRFGGTDYQAVMAGSVLVSIPPLIVFLIFQKNFVRGIALTGLKG